MSNTLTKIERLAQQFTRDLVDSLRGASIDELVGLSGKRAAKSAAPKSAAPRPAAPEAEAPKRRGRPPKNAAPAVKKPASASKETKTAKKADASRTRRSGDELVQIQAKVVKYIGAHEKAEGLAVSEIASGIKLEVEEITRALVKAVSAGQVRKTGEKRLTRYFPGDASAPEVEAPPASGPTATSDAEGAPSEATG